MAMLEQPSPDPFELFKKERDGKIFYAAGFPGFPGNFSRDTLLAGIIAGRADMLEAQLDVSTELQGKQLDPLTGEQPGKIHHESPGTPIGDYVTTYNACDTAGLFLAACEGLGGGNEPAAKAFVADHHDAITRAIDYILGQLDEQSIFWEYPPEGADRYALSVTYWKDSILPDPSGKRDPIYPIVYPLAHFMNARGILSAGKMLNDPDLAKKADMMFRVGIENFIRPDGYVAYKDAESELLQASSDELHALAYIPAEYAALLPLDRIRERAASLKTPFGYLCTPKKIAKKLTNRYHGDKVWVFEQALIHYGAKKFSLDHEADVAAAIAPHIAEGQELFAIGKAFFCFPKLVPEGNDQQLWSVAATQYFNGKSALSSVAWL